MPAEAKGSFDLDSVSPAELDRIVTEMGGQRQFSRHYGVARSTLQLRLNKVHRDPFHYVEPVEPRVEPNTGGVRRYLLTAAQCETALHEDFLTNLEAYRDYLTRTGSCEIMVSGFTYNKKLFTEHEKDKQPSWHYRLLPYMVHERIRLDEQIEFCGEMNSLPTKQTPLSGFETHTKHRWGIFPHAKLQLTAVPTMKHSRTKHNLTTGCVTRPNYVQKDAGIKAQFHHALAAVLVEIDADGTFFVRHLDAEPDGSFYDLDVRVQTVKDKSPRGNTPLITGRHRVEAINWGDVHTAQIDPTVARTCFGFYPVEEPGQKRRWVKEGHADAMIDVLRPKYQFLHDVSDFQARNHHNQRDPHHLFALYCSGVDSVEDEMREVATFIEETRRPFCQTVVVESNHDLALKRWLKEADYRQDPLNAEFFLDCQRRSYRAIRKREKNFSVFEYVLQDYFEGVTCEGVRFLREDESFVVVDIEKGMHGHLGANGARGTPKTFTRAGAKSTTGHTHTAQIIDGAYVAGTTSKMDMGYNKGLSSWSHSHVVTLPNGKRQVITMHNGKWRL